MATYAVMQSRVELSGHFTPHLLPSKPIARHQKPKLSLNTTPQRSFGRGTTGLRLETLSPSSPTRSNTYKNSYDPQIQPQRDQSSSCTSTPCATQTQPPDGLDPSSPVVEDGTDVASQLAQPPPYSLPPDTRSILTNGPLVKRQRSSQTATTPSSSTPSSASSIPSVKRVCFQDPVSEEIQTTQYLLKHSDIRSRSVSPLPSASNHHEPTTAHHLPPKAREVAPKGHPRLPVDDADENDEGEASLEKMALPKTPVAGRNKDREWVWTLGPIAGIKGPGSSLSTDDSSDEDLDDSLGETVAAASGFL